MVSLSNHEQMISRNKMTGRNKNLSFMELTIHTLKILSLAISTKSSKAMHQFGKLGDYDSLSPSTLRQQTVKEFLLVRRAKMRYSNKRVR